MRWPTQAEIAELLGFALLVAGLGMVAMPLGVILAGILLMLWGVVKEQRA